MSQESLETNLDLFQSEMLSMLFVIITYVHLDINKFVYILKFINLLSHIWSPGNFRKTQGIVKKIRISGL